MARQDLYILKRGETSIGLEGFVIVLDHYVLLLSLEYAEPSCHYLIGSTLIKNGVIGVKQFFRTVPSHPIELYNHRAVTPTTHKN